MLKKNALLFLMLAGSIVINSCRENPISPPEPLADGFVIYASMDGPTATWVLDPNTLEPFCKMPTWHAIRNYVDRPDSAAVYGIISPLGSQRGNLVQLNPTTSQVLFIDTTTNSYLFRDKDKQRLISIGGDSNPLIVYDIRTKQIIHIDTARGSLGCVASPIRSEIYLAASKTTYNPQSRTFDRILIYDLTTFSVTGEIPIGNRGVPMDMQISPDGKTLFLTLAYSTQTGDEFLVVDIEARSYFQVPYRIGVAPRIGVDRTGKYVYLTDPNGSMRISNGYYPRTNRVLRYDVANRRMEIFIQNAAQLGLRGDLLTQEIFIAPDNRTIFINAFTTGFNRTDDFSGIIKVDALTGRLIGKKSGTHITTTPRGTEQSYIFTMQSGFYKR